MSEPSGLIIQSEEGAERCFGCKNRTSLADAVVLEDGILCCRRCADNRTVIAAQASEAWSVEFIG